MSINPSGGYTDAGANYTDKLKRHYSNSEVAKIETKKYIHIITTEPQRFWQAIQAKVSWVYSEGTYQSLKFCLVSPSPVSKLAHIFMVINDITLSIGAVLIIWHYGFW